MFAAATPENTPPAYCASTSTNTNPVISPAFGEANYETLESQLRDRRRQMRNNDLRTELEYFSEDYDKEKEMKPRPRPARAVTPPLRAASPREKMGKSSQALPNNVGWNLPSKGGSFTNLPRGGHVPSTFTNAYVYVPKHAAYANPNLTGLFPNLSGLVTPFVRWIEDYPLSDGLKMPSHICSYDEKGDPDNFPIRSLVEHLSTDLLLTYKGLMEKTYTWVEAREIQEAITSGQLSHLVNDIKKEKVKSTDTSQGKGKKYKSNAPVEAPILMINREDYATKNTISESMAYKERITL
nr:reverse transcriptase domain-containing protein [Tanacetum cinerariifolium]GEZ92707.1 reverse transcriptase domain-containing protein [Tanacetum cinerariifolium]GFA42907.1 reverse transcriptase domain-containing protein [Tanacetum cinerariifolium]